MVKISALIAIVGADIDASSDYMTMLDMSEADASKNKKAKFSDVRIGLFAPIMSGKALSPLRVASGAADIDAVTDMKLDDRGIRILDATGTMRARITSSFEAEFGIELGGADTTHDAFVRINPKPGVNTKKSYTQFGIGAAAAESIIELWDGGGVPAVALRLTATPGGATVKVDGVLDFATSPLIAGAALPTAAPTGNIIYALTSADLPTPANFTYEGLYRRAGDGSHARQLNLQPGLEFRDLQVSDFTGTPLKYTVTASDFGKKLVMPTSGTAYTISVPGNINTDLGPYTPGYYAGQEKFVQVEQRAGQTITYERGAGSSNLIKTSDPAGTNNASVAITGFGVFTLGSRGTYWLIYGA